MKAKSDATYEEFTAAMEQIGKEVLVEYQNLYKRDVLDIRVPLVVTGEYRHPHDIQAGVAASLLIWETANSFVPQRTAVAAPWGVNAQVTSVMAAIIAIT